MRAKLQLIILEVFFVSPKELIELEDQVHTNSDDEA